METAIHVEDHGSGPTVLLLHGMPSAPSDFAPLIENWRRTGAFSCRTSRIDRARGISSIEVAGVMQPIRRAGFAFGVAGLTVGILLSGCSSGSGKPVGGGGGGSAGARGGTGGAAGAAAGGAAGTGTGAARGTGGGAGGSGNTGTGGTSAGGAAGMTSSGPIVLVPFNPDISLIGPATIAIDDGYVYWVGGDTAGTVRVQRVPKAGGDVTVAYQPPVRPGQGTPGPFISPTLAVDATSLYVVIGNDIYTSEILKVAKDGSTQTAPSLLQVSGLGRDAGMLAIDDQNVYFTAPNGGIARVPINGGPRATVVSPYLNGQDGVLAPGPNDPISGMPIGFPGLNYYTLVSDGTSVYYATSHWMLKAPVGGGAPVVLVPDATDAANVSYVGCIGHPAVTGGYVYWINYGDVFRVSVNGVTPGTEPETLVTGMTHGDCGYAVTDGQSIYYLDSGNLWKLALTGGPPVKLFDFGTPTNYSLGPQIVVDDTSVYLVAFGGHGIVKIAK